MSPLTWFILFLFYVCPVLLLISGIVTLVRARARLRHVSLLGVATLVVITLAAIALHTWLMQKHAAICRSYLRRLEHGSFYNEPIYPVLRAAFAPMAALFVLQWGGRWHQALVAATLVAFYPPADVGGLAVLGGLLGAAGIAEFRRQHHWIYVVVAVSSLAPAAAFLFWDPQPVWSVLILTVVFAARWLPDKVFAGGRWVGWGVSVAIVLAVVPVAIAHMIRDLKRPELFTKREDSVGLHDTFSCPDELF